MSYGRNPNYIYSDGSEMHFNFKSIPEDAVNQLLYHLLLSHRREELKERLLNGESYYMKMVMVTFILKEKMKH